MGGAPPPPLGVAPQGQKNRKNSTLFGSIFDGVLGRGSAPNRGGEGGSSPLPNRRLRGWTSTTAGPFTFDLPRCRVSVKVSGGGLSRPARHPDHEAARPTCWPVLRKTPGSATGHQDSHPGQTRPRQVERLARPPRFARQGVPYLIGWVPTGELPKRVSPFARAKRGRHDATRRYAWMRDHSSMVQRCWVNGYITHFHQRDATHAWSSTRSSTR